MPAASRGQFEDRAKADRSANITAHDRCLGASLEPRRAAIGAEHAGFGRTEYAQALAQFEPGGQRMSRTAIEAQLAGIAANPRIDRRDPVAAECKAGSTGMYSCTLLDKVEAEGGRGIPAQAADQRAADLEVEDERACPQVEIDIGPRESERASDADPGSGRIQRHRMAGLGDPLFLEVERSRTGDKSAVAHSGKTEKFSAQIAGFTAKNL